MIAEIGVPITLLNVDYKIVSRAIAGRLLKVIHLVVNPNQTCGVPGRYIGDSVAFLRDVVSYAFLSGTPVAIYFISGSRRGS